MDKFNFSAASDDEPHVFGSQRPGYYSIPPISDDEVNLWITYMKNQGIKRICCLLMDKLSKYKSDLLGMYEKAFGERNLCWVPVKDFTLVKEESLMKEILLFLATSVQRKEPVVVHCSGGIGRTGHVLAAWLVYGRNMNNDEAIQAVIDMGRNPYEAEGRTPEGKAKLNKLLNACRTSSTDGFA